MKRRPLQYIDFRRSPVGAVFLLSGHWSNYLGIVIAGRRVNETFTESSFIACPTS